MSGRKPAFGLRGGLLVNVVFATVVLCGCLAAALRVPIRKAEAWLIVVAAVAIASHAARRLKRRDFSSLGILTLSGVVFSLVAAASSTSVFSTGLFSLANDSWAYCAFGQYLRDYSRGTEGGLALVDQFASGLSQSRFGTGSLLAFLSSLTGLPTITCLLPWYLLVQTNAFLGCYAMGRLFRLPPALAMLFGGLYLVNGWTGNALIIGSLDNLLFLSLLPGVLGGIMLYARTRVPGRGWWLSAVPVAATLYSYPEGTAVAAFFLWPLLLRPVSRVLSNRPHQTSAFVIVAISTALLSPYVGEACYFLERQVSHAAISASARQRPGEGVFPHLVHLDFGWFSALFGHGVEYLPRGGSLLFSTCGVLLLLLLISGPGRSVSLWACMVLWFALLGWYTLREHYDYAAFKVIYVGSMVWIVLFIRACHNLLACSYLRRHGIPQALTALLLSALLILPRLVYKSHLPMQADTNLSAFTSLKNAGSVLHGKSAYLLCENPVYLQWAALFTRSLKLNIPVRTLYLARPYLQQKLNQARGVPLPEFVLRDVAQPQAIWENGLFSLAPLRGASLVGIDAPNGVEGSPDSRFLWFDTKPVDVMILSDVEREVRVSAECSPGPDLMPESTRELQFELDGTRISVRPGTPFSVLHRLKPGLNHVFIRCLNDATNLVHANGDPRTLVVRMAKITLRD